jgi:flagellar hook-associated protein 3 FlgL
MKATQGTTYRSLQAQINQMGLRLENLRNVAASGKKLNRPSDDPAAIRPVLNTRTEIRATERYLSTMGTAMDKMQALDGHLGHVENVLVRVKELSINSINGSLSPRDQETLAQQVGAMKAELLDAANAQVDGKYIFAGFAESTKPFVANPAYDPADPASRPVLFQGDGNATELEIAPGETIQVALTGDAVFQGEGSGGIDLFNVLTKIEEAMRSNDPAGVSAQLEALEKGADQARSQRGLMGNNAQRVETAMGHLEEVKIDLKQILSRYEDADIIETLTSLTQQETAFEAALNVTAKVSRLSILNFL